MSVSHVISQNWSGNGTTIDASNTYTADSQVTLNDVAVPDSSTDMFVALAIDFSELKSLYIKSDQDMTLETNDGSAPDDTINLVAGVPLVWNTDSDHDNPLTADVTALYVTQSSGSAATLNLRALTDPTP